MDLREMADTFPVVKQPRLFQLGDGFLLQYVGMQPKWGPIGYVTYKRTYARPLEAIPARYQRLALAAGLRDSEEWWLTLARVVEGTYQIQQRHCEHLHLPWREAKAQRSAQEMYRLIWDFKFLPPGRGLWMMGTDYVTKAGGASLNNCAMVSTAEINTSFSSPFCFLMDMSMLGIGVGGDCRGAGTLTIQKPVISDVAQVADTREGWVDLIRRILDSYAGVATFPLHIDYSLIRPAGALIRGFGGTAAGAQPLIELVDAVQQRLDAHVGKAVTSEIIVDLFNLIGRCVVAGNVRRSAEIMFGDPTDEAFLELKDPTKNGDALRSHRWASNNSIFAEVGQDYTGVAARTAKNGEPGYLWLENARQYSRMGRAPDGKDLGVAGANPCNEQSLESFELCCVSAATRILTRDGYPCIYNVVGKSVDVWNGTQWSTVTPFVAAKDKKLYRVHLSDGSYLDVTSDHAWSARSETQRAFHRVETSALREGMQLEACEPQATEGGVSCDYAYQAGWVAGDGYIDNERVIALVQESEYAVLSLLGGVPYAEQHPVGYTRPFRRVSLHGVVPLPMAKQLRDHTEGLPEEVFTWDYVSLAAFFGGWIDTDGCLRVNPRTDHYVLHGSEAKLRDAQMLLRRFGVNHASLRLEAEEGEETNYGERTHDLWVLLIPSYEASRITTFMKKARRFGSRFAPNNAHPKGEEIDRARKQRVLMVEPLPGLHTVYCFSEPERHMGVFGNVLTYQCLVESFPSRHETYDEFRRTLKFAYLYAKTVTLVSTHDSRTNAVLLRNRRIGTSMSGIVQAFHRHGRRNFFQWCDQGYDYLKQLDDVYSRWLCVPKSVKVTSIKPSGTVSLLPGVTPGIHYPHSAYYFRVIRFASNSPLVHNLRAAGYRCVDLAPGAPNTTAIYFAVKEPFFQRAKKDVTMWEQLENAAALQEHWADNQVSVTVTFQPHEACDIVNALEHFETRLKGVSFLPLVEHGYHHAPYQTIDEKTYEDYCVGLRELHLDGPHEVTDAYCDGDACQVSHKA